MCVRDGRERKTGDDDAADAGDDTLIHSRDVYVWYVFKSWKFRLGVSTSVVYFMYYLFVSLRRERPTTTS